MKIEGLYDASWGRLRGASDGDVDEQTALESFDAWFLAEMLSRSAPSDPSGLLDGGQAGRMYRDHLYQEWARMIADRGDFGLARSLEGELARDAAPRTTRTAEEEG